MPDRYLGFTFPGVDNVRCAFGTRLGGMSRGMFASNNISLEVGDDPALVSLNRENFCRELGFSRLVELKQVHGREIHFEIEDNCLSGPGAVGDGATLSSPGACVMIKTADCQPIFLVHESGRYVCGLHAGWRGNRDDFPGIGVKEFCDFYRISPDQVMAVRGPGLGPCCSRFEVFEEHWSSDYRPYYSSETRTMDLWSLTRDQLKRAGIPAKNIFSIDLCTRCQEELFFSYRREKNCGRQGNFIGLV